MSDNPVVPTPAVSGGSAVSGRGGQGRGRGGRGRGRGGRGNRTAGRTAAVFSGNTDGMKGNVFQCYGEHTNKQQFLKTVGVLEEHINKTFTYPQDIALICKSFSLTTLTPPPNLTKTEYENDMAKKMIWETTMKTYMKRVDMMESNLRGVYAIVWGQCSQMMQSKLESLDNYETKSTSCDCIWLLKEIQGITHRFEGTRKVFDSLDDAWRAYYAIKQGPEQSLHEYLKDYQSVVQVLEHYGAAIGSAKPYTESVKARVRAAAPVGLTAEEYAKRDALAAKQESIALCFLKCADKRRYGGLWSELRNNFTRGQDQYPVDLTSAYNLLLNYTAAPVQRPPRCDGAPSGGTNNDEEVSGVSFLQAGTLTPGTNNITHEHVRCYSCQLYGHYSTDCPTAPAQEEVQMLQLEATPFTPSTTAYESGFSFTQAATGHNIIPPEWILLDSQSTVSVFKNKALLTNIRPSTSVLRVHTNGGTQLSTAKGHIKNFGDVWYNPESLANILSMAEVRKVCRITMDTSIEPAMNVHRMDGSIMKFQEYKSGLYFFDTTSTPYVPNTYSPAQLDYLFLNTVAENKNSYTRCEIEGADRARALYRKIGRPSETEFQKILEAGLIRNCPVTPDDAKRALKIYGPDIATLKGKTVKRQNKGIPNFQATMIPAPVIAQYKDVRLFVDIFWVNGSPFLHTISEWIKFRTIAPIPNRSRKTLFMETKVIIQLYESRGFSVTRVEADQEFACIQHDLLPTPINIADTDDHVHEVERSIRTIKERTRCLIQGLPFKRIPKAMTRAAVENANKVMNMFPAPNGVSATMSPLTIMTGKPNPDYNDMKIEFGSYAQVYENNDPTNTVKARTTGAIALTPTGNAQGGYFFLSLATGRKLSRQQWETLPMPDGVIAAVEEMAQAEQQPLIGNGAPFFEWAPGIEIVDDGEIQPNHMDFDDEHPDGDEIGEYNNEEPGAEYEPAVVPDYNNELEGNDEVEPNMHIGEPLEEYVEEDTGSEVVSEAGDFQEDEFLAAPFDHEEEAADTNEEEEEQPQVFFNEQNEPEDDHGGQAAPAEDEVRRYNLRPGRERNYQNRLGHIMDNPASSKSYDTQFLQTDGNAQLTLRAAVQDMKRTGGNTEAAKNVVGVMMMQMTARAGIKKHGQVAIDALFEEFSQLHDLGVFLPQKEHELTASEKRGALRAINVIKEKRCGKIKGRTVADGSIQRDLYTKDETSSPTVSTDALMLSLIIDAFEKRDVATADVAGAYLHAEMDDFTLLKMEGESVEIMCNVSHEYASFVCEERGRKVLYLRLLKALYGCVKSALLWYELFSTTLKDLGFELNPYDTCVANKIIDGSQCTIVWYVDDTKISHRDGKVVSHVIETIEKRFGKMTVTRGKEHSFLGMDISIHENGTASIKMSEYIKEAIKDFGEDVTRAATTPAKKTLFEIDTESEALPDEKREKFHSIVAKLLYISKRGRLDIQLAIAFLCTRVARSTKEDWAKLRRVLEYLHGTIDEFLTIGADDMSIMNTWIDASYALHPDMKSHTHWRNSFLRDRSGFKQVL